MQLNHPIITKWIAGLVRDIQLVTSHWYKTALKISFWINFKWTSLYGGYQIKSFYQLFCLDIYVIYHFYEPDNNRRLNQMCAEKVLIKTIFFLNNSILYRCLFSILLVHSKCFYHVRMFARSSQIFISFSVFIYLLILCHIVWYVIALSDAGRI